MNDYLSVKHEKRSLVILTLCCALPDELVGDWMPVKWQSVVSILDSIGGNSSWFTAELLQWLESSSALCCGSCTYSTRCPCRWCWQGTASEVLAAPFLRPQLAERHALAELYLS